MHGFSTKAIHAGQAPDPTTGAVILPIHPSSTYAQDGVGGTRSGYEYSRSANPTRTALQECLAALEGGRHAVAFGSGMGASDVLLRVLLSPGDHIVIPHDAYGGTFRLVDKVLRPWGIEHAPVDLADVAALRAALRPETRAIWCETPTNPLLGIADIAAVADVAREAAGPAGRRQHVRLAVPAVAARAGRRRRAALHHQVHRRPLRRRRRSAGHLRRRARRAAAFTQNAVGSVPGPFDAWLTLRGVKTLAVRMERHSDNAERVVEFLTGHPAVAQVLYPGLPEHPGHEVAAKQMRRFGGMVSIRLRGGREAALRVCAATEVFTLAESLGGVESLIEHPGQMTHMSVAGSALQVPDDLVRLSVGIEDVEDLVEDLRNALDRA